MVLMFLLTLPGRAAVPIGSTCVSDIPGIVICDNAPDLCSKLPTLREVSVLLVDGMRDATLDASCVHRMYPKLEVGNLRNKTKFKSCLNSSLLSTIFYFKMN